MKKTIFILPFSIFIFFSIVINADIIQDRVQKIIDEQISQTDSREQQLSEIFFQEWLGNHWQNYQKAVLFYDENGNLIEERHYYWDSNNWFLNYTVHLYYDDNDNVIEALVQFWEAGGWHDLYLYLITYDENNNVIEQLVQNKIGNDWVNSMLYSFIYDANDLMLEQLVRSWGIDWQNDEKYTYSYDESENMIHELLEEWSGSEWLESYQNINTYNENNLMIESLGQYFYMDSWLNDVFITFTYDDNENMLTRLAQYWFLEEWFNNELNTFDHDFEGNVLEDILQIWTDDWENEHRTEFVYENVRIEDNEIYAENISLSNFPNPFTSQTTFHYFTAEVGEDAEISIYNLKGQKVKQFSIADRVRLLTDGRFSIEWNGTDEDNKPVDSGIYFYRLKTGNTFSQTRKMVLMR